MPGWFNIHVNCGTHDDIIHSAELSGLTSSAYCRECVLLGSVLFDSADYADLVRHNPIARQAVVDAFSQTSEVTVRVPGVSSTVASFRRRTGLTQRAAVLLLLAGMHVRSRRTIVQPIAC